MTQNDEQPVGQAQGIDVDADDNDSEKGNGHGGDNGHDKDIVNIYVNDVLVRIHRGHQTSSTIKAAAMEVQGTGVSSVDVLYSVPEYNEIGDAESVVIHGDERFKTTPPDGSSS
jgi:hypothetical protein